MTISLASPAAEEKERRLRLWRSAKNLSSDEVSAASLRDLGIYGGAQGIWVDKARTGPISDNGAGVTVGLLHTGKHYPDDISEDGLIYHYPSTERPPSRDASEVEATKNAARLALPLFVILPGKTDSTRRVQLGWVEDWDDEAALFLVFFGNTPPTYAPAAEPDEPFSLIDDAPKRKATVNVRARQQTFRFQVLAQYGTKCAVCPITHPNLVKAAHIRGKREKGSDDWRNGIPLCSTHHDAFDAQLFAIHPDTLSIVTAPDVDPAAIGLGSDLLAPKHRRPHREALAWRFQLTQSKWRTKTAN
jgi:putative restriction endonuclease